MAVIEQLGNLEYKITLNTTDLEKGQQRASSVMSRLNSALGGLANLHLATQGVKAFAQRLVGMGTDVIKAATTMESLQRGLAAVAGGAAMADKQLIGLREVAKLPGLGLQEAIQGAVNLQAAGLSAERATDSLKAFGNALATVGKGKAELDGVILALTQMQAKGKLSAEEINQIAERVPQIRRVMVEAFGTAIPKEIEKMGISVDDFIDKVNQQLLTLPQIVGGAANTFENLGDTIFEAKTRIGELFLPAVLSAAESFATAIGGINDALRPLSEEVATNIEQWESLKGQWEAQDTEITSLVGQYETLKTRLTEITTAGGDTFAVNEDLERVNKRLIELVPQLGVAYDTENKSLVGLNETLERHREIKGRMLRQLFRENIEQTTKAVIEATEAEKTAIRQRDLHLYVMKRVVQGEYELGKVTGRTGQQMFLNTAAMKGATTVSQLYRDARTELGLTEKETIKSQIALKEGLKAHVSMEETLSAQIKASTDAVKGYRTEIETNQASVRSYVETTGKANIKQFNALVDIYANLSKEQGLTTGTSAEYEVALKALAVQVGLTGTVLEQGLGDKITVVEGKINTFVKADYGSIFLDAKIRVPTDKEISQEIKDFTKKVRDAIALVSTTAKDEGTYDPKKVIEDQLDTLKSMLKAEGITEEALKKEYTAIYAARAALRHNLKVINDGIAKKQADVEIAAKKKEDAAKTASANAYKTMIFGWRTQNETSAKDAATALMGIVEGEIDERTNLETKLQGLIVGFQNARTDGEIDSLGNQLKALKDQNPLLLTEYNSINALVALAEEARAKARIKYAGDTDDEILKGAKDFLIDRATDEANAEVTRKKLDDSVEERRKAALKAIAGLRAEELGAFLKAWDEVGDSIVNLGTVIDEELGQNLEVALNFGGAFLETMQAVQLALAGTGTWWTVAAAGIGLVTTMLTSGGIEGKNAKRRRELQEEVEAMAESVTELEQMAGLGEGYWRNVGKDMDRLQAARKRQAAANQEFIHGTIRDRDKQQAAQREYDAATRALHSIEEEENRKHKKALATYETDLKLRVAMIEDITGDLVGAITDTLANAMGNYSEGWDKVEDAIERNLMDAIFQGVLDAQMQRHQLEPLVEQYVAFLTNALADDELSWDENSALKKQAKAIKMAGIRIRFNAKRLLDEAWGFDFDKFFPDEEELADLSPPISPTVDLPEIGTGLTTSIRQITRTQADALAAVFSNISAINGRIADNTLRTADLLESYLPGISGNQLMTQSTDVGGLGYNDPSYTSAMALNNANRAN